MGRRRQDIKYSFDVWSDRIEELKHLATVKSYRVKDLAQHFGVSVGSVSSTLNRRGLSLIKLRHDYKNGKKV